MSERRAPGSATLVETWRQAVVVCLAHPLRTALGALAIAAAVGTLTVVETAVDTLAVYARESAARVFGSETFVVARIGSPGTLSRRELAERLERNRPIRRSDLRALERWAEGRVLYAPTTQIAADVVAGDRRFEGASVSGTGASLPRIRDLGIAEGRFFLPVEERSGAQVVVIGADVADTLFPGLDPLGRSLRLGGRGFRVIGVQARLGTTSGVSLDRYVWTPLVAWERVFGPAETLQLSARSPEGAAVERAEDRARASLRALHHLAPGEEDDFDVLLPEAARNFVLELVDRVGAVTPVLTAMALLAAIVVVTNTTLVSVAQRTWEIGVRRAVGATRGQIVREVLAESLLVSFLGGAVAVLVVSVLARLVASTTGLPVAVEGRTVITALVAATLAGLLAGGYPASRAARTDVIQALRQE